MDKAKRDAAAAGTPAAAVEDRGGTTRLLRGPLGEAGKEPNRGRPGAEGPVAGSVHSRQAPTASRPCLSRRQPTPDPDRAGERPSTPHRRRGWRRRLRADLLAARLGHGVRPRRPAAPAGRLPRASIPRPSRSGPPRRTSDPARRQAPRRVHPAPMPLR